MVIKCKIAKIVVKINSDSMMWLIPAPIPVHCSDSDSGSDSSCEKKLIPIPTQAPNW